MVLNIRRDREESMEISKGEIQATVTDPFNYRLLSKLYDSRESQDGLTTEEIANKLGVDKYALFGAFEELEMVKVVRTTFIGHSPKSLRCALTDKGIKFMAALNNIFS